MPAGAEPTTGHRAANAAQSAANTLRNGYNYSVGNDRHFGPQQKPVGWWGHAKNFASTSGKVLTGRSPTGNAVLAGVGRAMNEADDVDKVLTSPTASNYDKAAQVAESTGSVAGTIAGAYTGWKSGTALGAAGGGLFGGVGAGPGAVVGGLIGGGLGAYYGGEAVDAGVNKLRDMFGLDTTSTVDRVAAQDVAAKDEAAKDEAAKQSQAATPDDRNPYADQNQAKLEAFALAEKQRAESEQLRQLGESFESRPGANGARPDLGYGPIGDREKLTNERAAAMNPQGRITAVRQPNGTMSFSGTDVRGQVSYNDADGKALPGGGLRGQFSGFDVAPAGSKVVMSDGGYAFSTSGDSSGTTPQGNALRAENALRAQALGVDTAGLNPWQAQQYLKEVADAQATNAAGAAQAAAYDRSGKWMGDLRDPRTMALRNASVGSTIFRNRRERDAAMRERQKNYENTWNLVAGAPDREANRELEYTKSANTLRGQQMNAEAQMYSSDNTLRGNMYQSDLTAATAAQKAEADRRSAAYTQAKDYTAAQRTAREETVNMFRREGDKDAGAAETRVRVADQVMPGFSTMDTESKVRARPQVEAGVDLFERMKSQTPQGLWEKLTSSDKPGLTGLPSIKGWAVERSFGGDHYIKDPKSGQTINIGSGLNTMQLQMLQNATQTGSFLPKNK